MGKLSILLFGRMTVLHEGEEWQWERRKSQALIAFLASTGKSYSRDYLATLLWENSDGERARASLRRILTDINNSPVGQYLLIDRQNISLNMNENLFVDVQEFEKFAEDRSNLEALNSAADLYKSHFLEGFSIKDSVMFDDWQAERYQFYANLAQTVLERLARLYMERQNFELAQHSLQQLRLLNAYHEGAVKALLEVYQHLGLRHAAISLYENYSQVLADDLAEDPSSELQAIYDAFKQGKNAQVSSPKNVLPPSPSLVVGRESLVNEFKQYLLKNNLLVLQGWPGIGKTTLSSVLAHDKDLSREFSDGILWASLGENPDLLAILKGWGEATNCGGMNQAKSIEEAASKLTSHLFDKRVLVIIDDVWQVEHGQVLSVAGKPASSLYTSRFNDIAYQLCQTPENLRKIPILSVEDSLDLVSQLAPDVLKKYPQASRQLVTDLEGLPLALQVAGRLLYAEYEMGWSVEELLRELAETSSLLQSRAPADRMDIASQTTPTIAALLERSVAHLPIEMQERFAILGVFAPKPATFSYDAIAAVWQAEDSKASLRTLVNRGLLEPIGQNRFQMHALLVMLARSMVGESDVK